MLRTPIKLILVLMSLTSVGFTKDIRFNDLDFRVSKEMLKSSNNYYSFGEFKGRRFLKTSLAQLDVENLSEKSNTRIFSSKFLFNIDIPLSHINRGLFSNTKIIKQIMGAKEISKIDLDNDIWSSSIPIFIIKVKSKLQVKRLDSSNVVNDIYGDYFQVIDGNEANLPQGDFQVHMRLTEFNVGIDRLIVMCNFIAMGNKTTVITYIIARAKNNWWRKTNVFGVATKRMKNLILKVGRDTKNVLIQNN